MGITQSHRGNGKGTEGIQGLYVRAAVAMLAGSLGVCASPRAGIVDPPMVASVGVGILLATVLVPARRVRSPGRLALVVLMWAVLVVALAAAHYFLLARFERR